MHVLRRTLRALSAGTAAGAAALMVDQLLALSTLGYPVPLGGRFVFAYLALGAVLGLAVELGWRASRRDSPRATGIFALTAALVYAPAIFERVHQALVFRAGQPPAVAAAAFVTGAYGLWILILRRVAGPHAESIAPLLGALTAAAGLAVNRHLVDYPLEPMAIAADAAVLVAGLLLAWVGRAGGARRRAVTLALLALGATLFAARGVWRPPAAPVASHPGRPHLVLVVIDTLRQDVFEAVLEETAEGRAFREAMDGAAWFTQAIAASPWTAPSIGTLMTGLHPREHGLELAAREDPSRPLAPLPDSVPTLAEHFRERGYWTEAIVTNPMLHPISGIARGFESYEILSGPTVTLPPLTALARLGLMETLTYQPASVVRRRLKQRLGPIAATGRPVFLWLHLLEPHEPLRPHRGLAPDPAGAGLGSLDRLYRDEVRYALVELKRMIELLADRGLWDDTVLVMVSDHGEMLPSDDHDNDTREEEGQGPKLYGHGHALYDELVRVPLVIRPRGGLLEDRRIDALASHADVFDTVSDLLHLGVTPPGEDRMNLAPWLAATLPAQPPRERDYALIGGILYGPEQRALRTRELKLIDYPRGQRPSELYLIAEDPRERHDVARRETERLARAEGALDLYWSRLGAAPEARPTELDAATLERLKALGYMP